MVDFKQSETKKNLMRAFAGECQARTRYDFSAEVAMKENYSVLHDLFKYTANQEKAHAKVYIDTLKQFSGEEIDIDASYPVDAFKGGTTLNLLRESEKHEKAEHDVVYADFSKAAKEEGFDDIAKIFDKVASVEKIHSERFKKYAERLENGTLEKDTQSMAWMCTNCGFIYEGTEPPAVCPLCNYPKGYYIRFTESSFE